jgi:ABC-type nitrate/sulfonate/bicarbonate transport system permease component
MALARYRPGVLGLMGLATFAVALEIAPRAGLVPSEYAPPTSRIVSALANVVEHGEFWLALRDTLITWAVGLGIAVAAGVVVGVVLGSVPLLWELTSTTVEFLRPIPSVALIPLVIVLYGSSIKSAVVLVVYASFWQVLIQVLHGVADVDPVARDTARAYQLGRWARIRYLVWPTALPYVVTGVRLAASVALILAITGELVVGSPGLGKEIEVARQSGAVEVVYALVVVTGVLGVLANVATRAVEVRVLSWHTAVRRDTADPVAVDERVEVML